MPRAGRYYDCPCGSLRKYFQCAHCKEKSCARCDDATPRLGISRWFVCNTCNIRAYNKDFAALAIPEKFMEASAVVEREKTIARAAGIVPDAQMAKWKPNTKDKYSNSARAIENYGEARGILLMGTAPTPGKKHRNSTRCLAW